MFRKVKIVVLSVAVLLAVYGFNSLRSSDRFKKLKTFSELLRLINDNYVEDVDVDAVLDGAIVGMLNELDPHSTYISTENLKNINEQFSGKFEGIGIEFDILDDYITVISPIPGTPSDRAGLQTGDKIIKINNESAYKITFDEVFKKLRGPKGSRVDISVKRPDYDDLIEITIIRDEIPIFSVLASFLIDDETGYVKINRFSSTTTQEFRDAMDKLINEGMEQLILDLRNNGGGLMDEAISMVDLFVSSNDTILMTKGRIRGSDSVYRAHGDAPYKDIPVITIINRGSASASEIVSGAFQDLDRGIVLGETSFGKGLVQRQFQLRDGSAARITIARYYTPSGRLIQRPFDKTYENYYTSLGEESREATDSLLAERPQYKTNNGRLVYGGGGITPDFHIPTTIDLSTSTRNILTHPDRIPFNYAGKLNESLNGSYSTYIEFAENYKIETENKTVFYNWLTEQEVEFTEEEVLTDWGFIENRIMAQIASARWGKVYLYKTYIEVDEQVQAALEHFDAAQLLIKVH